MAKQSESKLFAFLGVFLGLIGWIIVMLAKKNDKYATHYGRQGLVLTLVAILSSIISIVPIVGWIVGALLYVATVVVWVLCLVNSLSGSTKPIPLFEKYAKKVGL